MNRQTPTARIMDSQIWSTLPYPIAAAWRSALLAEHALAQRSRLVACHEALLRTLLAFLLADYVRGPRSPELDQQILALKRPGEGRLARIVQQLARYLHSRPEEPPFLPELDPWLHPESEADDTPVRAWRDIGFIRNRRAHHDAPPDSETAAREEANALREPLRALLGSLRWLGGYRMISLKRVEPSERDERAYRGRVQVYAGREDLPEPCPAEWEATPRLLGGRVYLLNPAGDAALSLDPFVQVLPCPHDHQHRLFLLKEIGRRGDLRLRHGPSDTQLWVTPRHLDRSTPFHKWLRQSEKVERRHVFRDCIGTLRASPGPQRPARHERLDGRYEVLDKIGTGGMGEVFRVHDHQFGEERALKLLRDDLSGDAVLRARFLREADTALKLRHPNILPVYDRGELADGELYLTMPLVTGGSLKDRLEEGGVPWEREREWARQALEALAFLHGCGVVHRDVKPSNLLVDDKGQVLLSDFGIAHRQEDAHLTATEKMVGTAAYIPPEQKPGREVDGRADVFALAVVLHQLRTGGAPTPNPGEGIDGPEGAWLRQLGAKQVDERPYAAQALESLPGPVPDDAPAPDAYLPTAEPSAATDVPRTRTKTGRWLAAVAALAVAVALGGCLAVALGLGAGPTPALPAPNLSTTPPPSSAEPAKELVTDRADFASCGERDTCAGADLRCLAGKCVAKDQVQKARAAYADVIAAYNRGDRAVYVGGFANPMDCYYSAAHSPVGDMGKGRMAQFAPDAENRRRYELRALPLISEAPGEVAFWDQGLLFRPGTGRPPQAYDKAIVMKQVTKHIKFWDKKKKVYRERDVVRWFIAVEVGCSGHSCYPKPFEDRKAAGGKSCPGPE